MSEHSAEGITISNRFIPVTSPITNLRSSLSQPSEKKNRVELFDGLG